jgi:hypothetical protein
MMEPPRAPHVETRIAGLVAAPRARFIVVILIIVSGLSSLLELRGHRTVRITATISDIQIGSVAAADRISAAVCASLIVLSAGLELRWDHPVRVTKSVPRIQIEAVAARRWMSESPIPALKKEGLAFALRGSTKLKSDRDGCYAQEHFTRSPGMSDFDVALSQRSYVE